MGKLKNFIYGGLAALVMNLSSCERPEFEDPKPEPYVNPNPELYENARVLEIPLTREFNYGDYLMYLSEPLDESYTIGTVLGAAPKAKAPNGFCVKFVAVNMLDRNSVYVEPAGLDKAIKSGTLNFNQYLNPDDVDEKSSEELYCAKGVNLKSVGDGKTFNVTFDEVLLDQDGDLNTTDDQARINGYASFKAKPYLNLEFDEGVKSLSTGLIIEGDSKINFEAEADYNFSKEKALWSKYFIKCFAIHDWPVVLAFKLEFAVGGEGDLESRVATGIEDNFYTSAGISWERGIGWRSSENFENNFEKKNLEIDLSGSATGYLKFTGSILPYGGPGPASWIKTSTTLEADIHDNPWWTLDGHTGAYIGIDPSFLSSIIGTHEKEIYGVPIHIADAGGPFFPDDPDDPPEGLDSLVIQPGPEGNDAWIEFNRVAFPDCSNVQDYFGGFGNETYLDAFFAEVSSCEFSRRNIFIKIPSEHITPGAISSAKLCFYGYTEMNTSDSESGFALYKLNWDWEDNSVSWDNAPENEFLKYLNFSNDGNDYSWKFVDVTSVVRDWINGEPNYGFEISSRKNHDRAVFYSGDNSDAEKRPKLVIHYSSKKTEN